MARIGQNGVNLKETEAKMGGGWTHKPEGWHRMIVLKGDYYYNKNQRGIMKLELHYTAPEYAGGYEVLHLTLEGGSEKVTQIAYAQLKTLAIAVDHPDPDLVQDTDELLNKPFMVRVYHQSAEPGAYGRDSDGKTLHFGDFKSEAAHAASEAGSLPSPAPVAPPSNAPVLPPGVDAPF